MTAQDAPVPGLLGASAFSTGGHDSISHYGDPIVTFGT
jgi:hypothetical protein